MIVGEVRVVDDVPSSFADLVAVEMKDHPGGSFRLGCSGGASGAACFSRLAEADLAWGRIACYFADERCVDPDSSDANQKVIAVALGARSAELAGFFPMSCSEGAGAYAVRLRAAGGFDLLQLGVGADGHTASLFPGAEGPPPGSGELVIMNDDPSGRNHYPRMSLTFEAIDLARLVVITAIGADKASVLREVSEGAELPVAKVRAERVLWLVDRDAAQLMNSPEA
jgi:6-phosphogluconolactonase